MAIKKVKREVGDDTFEVEFDSEWKSAGKGNLKITKQTNGKYTMIVRNNTGENTSIHCSASSAYICLYIHLHMHI